MKTGLVTFYHIHHYGALLQACATEQAVKRLGSKCEIIDYYVNQDNRLFQRPTGIGSAAHDAHTALHYGPLKARYERFEEFARTRLSISPHHYESLAELRAAELPYDVILSGSDQIWNPKIFPDGKFDPVFFGAFSTKRKIAYAPSFGIPHVPENMEEELRGYLQSFSHLSVRERQGEHIVEEVLGQKVPVVLDPTLLLTRQNLELLPSGAVPEDGVSKGAYVVSSDPDYRYLLIATGSELTLAVKAVELMRAKGARVRLVSMPSMEIFNQQSEEYRNSVIPLEGDFNRVSIEAGSTVIWRQYVGRLGLCIGIDHFGASAPAKVLTEKYGFTPEAVSERILSHFAD